MTGPTAASTAPFAISSTTPFWPVWAGGTSASASLQSAARAATPRPSRSSRSLRLAGPSLWARATLRPAMTPSYSAFALP